MHDLLNEYCTCFADADIHYTGCSRAAESLLNVAGRAAQFVRSRCSFWGGILSKSSASEVNGQLIASGMSGGGFALLPGQAEGCYVPMLTLGVSRSSVNSGITLAFVSYALGAKAQDVMIDDSCGFPVNTTVLGATLAEGSNSEEEMSAGGGYDGIEWTDTWLDRTQCDQLREIINGLHTPVLVDYTLYQIIVNESMAFFDGRMDASQTAQTICAKANAYLTE